MIKRPLVWIVIAFCAGIFFASQIKTSSLLFSALILIFLAGYLWLAKNGIKLDLLLVCIVFLLGAIHFQNSLILPKNHIWLIYPKDNCLYTIKGFIKNAPLLENNRTSFLFCCKEIGYEDIKHNCCGDILVYLKGRKNISYAEELIISGTLRRPFSLKSTARKNNPNYLIMQVALPEEIIRLNKYHANPLKKLALWLKEKMEKVIFINLPLIPAGVLDAMVLGERKNIPAFINNDMIKSGTVHILVVSGFNVGIIAFALALLLKLIRVPKLARFYSIFVLLIIYCLMTGASTPVIRATIMAISFMLAYLLKREPDIYNSCALAAAFILAGNPKQLFNIGFQLSFISVISIIYLYPKLKRFSCLELVKIKMVKFISEGLLVSLSAWIGTFGLIAYYFKIISPITIIANLFIVPLASLITLSGLSMIILGAIYNPLAMPFAHTNEFLIALLVTINSLLLKIPGAYFYLP